MWIGRFDSVGKNVKIKAKNVDGIVLPVRLPIENNQVVR
jgi:hypothetical protein